MRFAGLLSALLCAHVSCVAAEAPSVGTIRDFRHTVWTLKDGAPAEIWSIAQTTDGWLWLGTPTGLYRFDGVHFERHDLLPVGSASSRAARYLLATRAGELWVAYLSGGGHVLAADASVRALTDGGLPATMQIDALREDCLGRVWATTARGLFHFENGRWSRADAQPGWPADATEEAVCDRDGALWVPADDGMHVQRKGAQSFELANVPAPQDCELVVTPHGALWVADHDGFKPFAGDRDAPPDGPVRPASRSYGWIFTRDGSYWSVYCPGSGVCRNTTSSIARKPFGWKDPMDAYRAVDGLSSNSAMALLEDREGNIWVGTKLGLDRFSHNNVTVVRFPQQAIYFALVPDADGVVWSGTSSRAEADDFWWRLDPKPTALDGFKGDVTAAYRDTDGSILLGGRDGLWRFANGKFAPEEIPAAEKGKPIQSIVRDAEGHLWIAFRSSPPYRIEGDTWLPGGNLVGLPDLPLTLMVRDAAGRLWFGFGANRLAILDGTRMRQFSEADGLRTGTVTALLPGDVTLVGGELGLAAFDGERFRSLQATRADVFTGITGLVRARDGSLWINGSAGAVHITGENLAQVLSEATFRTPYEVLDTEDGMPGSAQQTRPLPSLVEGSDGKLWFAASDGLAYIDPSRIQRNAAPPPVVIRALTVGDTTYAAGERMDLPPRTRSLRLDYSALTFAHPERTTFRYRLEGSDETWQDAGTRRQAYYTNLGPGDYMFRVIASNENGIWNDEGDALSITIAPAWYETKLFFVVAIVALLALVWAVHRMRVRTVARALDIRFDERLAERARIARELHDTLMQGVQGLQLSVHVAAQKITTDDESRRMLERTLTTADRIIIEGRNRVSSLRAERLTDAELLGSIETVACDLAPDEGVRSRVARRGIATTLRPPVADEIFYIAREALANAFRHSGASEIDVMLDYGRRYFMLSCRDNGRGFDPRVDEKPGHWGLRGMAERAEKLGARFDVMSGDARGTEIRIVVRASRVYVRRPGVWRRVMHRLFGAARRNAPARRGRQPG
ncbi:MAG: two-component regulator propeller domain-containing protein [Rhodanobacteraceae bacterium]